MSEDTPTQRLSQPDPEPGDNGGGDGGGAGMSKKLLITLISIGGALLIAVIVLLVVLLTSGGGDAQAGPSPSTSDSLSPSPTPSATENESPTPEPSPSETEAEEEVPPPPPPPSNDPTITTFTINNSTHPVVQCNAESPEEFAQSLLVKWSTSNVDQVFFGVATNDASTGALFENLPPSGNSTDNFPDGYDDGDFAFPCPGTTSQKYTITVVGNGQKVSKSVTVTNNGD